MDTCICGSDLALVRGLMLKCGKLKLCRAARLIVLTNRDAEHVLCDGCSRVWASPEICPECHINKSIHLCRIMGAEDIDENSISLLTRFFCAKIRDLSISLQLLPTTEESSSKPTRNINTLEEHKYSTEIYDAGFKSILCVFLNSQQIS